MGPAKTFSAGVQNVMGGGGGAAYIRITRVSSNKFTEFNTGSKSAETGIVERTDSRRPVLTPKGTPRGRKSIRNAINVAEVARAPRMSRSDGTHAGALRVGDGGGRSYVFYYCFCSARVCVIHNDRGGGTPLCVNPLFRAHGRRRRAAVPSVVVAVIIVVVVAVVIVVAGLSVACVRKTQ